MSDTPFGRSSPWSAKKLADLGIQVALLAFVGITLGYFASNAIANIHGRNLNSGFSFLGATAGFDIGETLIPFQSSDTYARALLAGLINTLVVSIICCIMATIIGGFLGTIAALGNPLLTRLTRIYVETCRNVPLLLQLFFWYAVLRAPSSVREAWNPLPNVYFSNRGLQLPWIKWDDRIYYVAAALAVAVLTSVALFFWSRHVQTRTGKRPKIAPWVILLCAGLPAVLGLSLGYRLEIDIPRFQGFGFRGGLSLSREFTALSVGLTLYVAAFISELVRGGIEAVERGQWEAARSLGLPDRRILRLIVLPLALRIIVPPVTSQYLNLTKNTSLAVAIGYPDLVNVSNTIINQSGQAIEVILLLMLVYLALSLCISAFMNWYNNLVALHEH